MMVVMGFDVSSPMASISGCPHPASFVSTSTTPSLVMNAAELPPPPRRTNRLSSSRSTSTTFSDGASAAGAACDSAGGASSGSASSAPAHDITSAATQYQYPQCHFPFHAMPPEKKTR